MLIELKLKVKTPIVGNTYDDGRRMFIFPRLDDAWALDIGTRHTWNGLLQNAVESLQLTVDPDTVRWPRTVLLPKLYLLERYGKKGKIVRHEAVSKHAVLTLMVMLRKTDGESATSAPSLEQLYGIFSFIGTYEGISPFGSATGYGQFDVESLSPVGRDYFDFSEFSKKLSERADVHDEEDGG